MTEGDGRQGRPQGREMAGVRKISTTNQERKQAMNDEQNDGDGRGHEGSEPEPDSGARSEPESESERKARQAARRAKFAAAARAEQEAKAAVWRRMFGDEDHEPWSRLVDNAARPLRGRQKIEEPWSIRPGCIHAPAAEAVAADDERCRRYWAPFARMHKSLGLFDLNAGASPQEQAVGGTRFTSPPCKRPLRFRAIFPASALEAMRQIRCTVEQGGMCRETILVGHRLITTRAIVGGEPVLEFWLAPCFRPGFEDHVEVVASFLLGTGYREGYIGFDGSEFKLAQQCLAHLRFAVDGPTQGRVERHTGHPGLDWMARQPAFEAMFFTGTFPEVWWIADPGDDPFAIEISGVDQ